MSAEKSSRNVIAGAVNIKRKYKLGEDIVWALKGITLDIFEGEYLSIMGPSGSGKSTFFNMIGALDVPTEGTIRFMGEDLFKLPEEKQAWVRCNKIGYIFQSYNLITVMTAIENVALPAIFRGDSQQEAHAKAASVLETVGLEHRKHHLPQQLSGGQQQRVAIARALVNSPAVILADEPTGNLDTKTGSEIIELLKRLQQEKHVTVVTATHDIKMLQISDRIVWIRDGLVERVEEHSQVKFSVG
jgi:putative ABC transport system ATP-binding protein